MKIWFDILTPKQLLFFEPMLKRLEKKNKLLCTSRKYREVNQLAQIRKLKLSIIGKHGGGDNFEKLQSHTDRIKKLSIIIKKFSPDLAVSFCSPEAARISHGLGIKHIAFCNAPHAEAVMKLSVPLVQKLLIPKHIPKKEFTKYGISKKNIIQYNAMDEYVIVKGGTHYSGVSKLPLSKPKTILIRTHEVKAAYFSSKVNIIKIIKKIVQDFPNCNILVLGRYSDEIASLKKSLPRRITVIDKVVDSGEILAKCDVFIGSGGTMTSEAALRGIPTISYDAVPNLDEKFLVRKGLVKRAKDLNSLIKLTTKFLNSDKRKFQKNARYFLNKMEDPSTKLETIIKKIRDD
ncbi:MAG: DUF354 domain-containing protein [Nitrosopumilaceae archaeon]